MLEHLSNPEYVHVLLNPLPVYGLAMGVLGLTVALIAGSRAPRVSASVHVFVSPFPASGIGHCKHAIVSRFAVVIDRPRRERGDEHDDQRRNPCGAGTRDERNR